MTTCTLKFAPITSAAMLQNPASISPGRHVYDRGSLTELYAVPIWVNHDPEQKIGRVLETFVFEDIYGPWLCAIAELHDNAAWIQRGTPCSVSFKVARSMPLGAGERILRGVLHEISVLSADRRPADRGAQVLSVQTESVPRVHAGNGRGLTRDFGRVLEIR